MVFCGVCGTVLSRCIFSCPNIRFAFPVPYPKIIITVKYRKGKILQPVINTTGEAVHVLRTITDYNTILWREELLMLCLNKYGKLHGWYPVSIGGCDSTIADIRIISTVAVCSAAAKVILAHNHPAGTLEPSIADLKTTAHVKIGLQTLGIELVDHIIITATGHFSLKDDGLM